MRAGDTGGAIEHRNFDCLVMSFESFRDLFSELRGAGWITPHVEAQRCDYLRAQ